VLGDDPEYLQKSHDGDASSYRAFVVGGDQLVLF
jgi:hypothetical protein